GLCAMSASRWAVRSRSRVSLGRVPVLPSCFRGATSGSGSFRIGATYVDEPKMPCERRPTGVPGLDRILDGGLLAAGVYIVQGPPGAGKTILANQACFHHASTGRQAVYVTLLAEAHSRMFAHLRRMAFFDEDAIPERVYYIGGYSALESGGLDALVTLVRGAIQKHKATLLVVDGLISVQESSPTDSAFKRFLHEIQTLADLTSCTALL